MSRGWWTQPRLDAVPDDISGGSYLKGPAKISLQTLGNPNVSPPREGQVRNGSRVSTVNVERERKLLPNDGEDIMVVTQERNPQHGRGHAGRTTGKAGRVDRGRRCGSGTAVAGEFWFLGGVYGRRAREQKEVLFTLSCDKL